jgi:acetamidase/formamidase
LSIDVEKDDAASVATLVNNITVGSLPQTPSTEFGMPASMFRPDATDAQMDWQICPAGTKIIIEVETTGGAFAEGDTLTVSAGIYGSWIRG